MFETRQTFEAVQVAAAGGGFSMNASVKQTTDLVQIASAASRSGARITFTGLSMRPTEDMIQIAAAGKGAVVFAD